MATATTGTPGAQPADDPDRLITVGIDVASAIERVTSDTSALQPLFDADRVDELGVARALLSILPCAVYAKDRDLRFVYANDALSTMVGVESPNDLLGLADHDIHPPHEAEIYEGLDRQVIDSGIAVRDLEERQTRYDGSVEVVRTTKIPVCDDDGGVVGLIGFSANVTEPERLSEALVISEQRYALAAAASRDGIWDYDVAGQSLLLSPRCAHIFGVAIDERPVPANVIDNRRASGSSSLQEAIDDVVRDPTTRLEIAVDIVRPNGTVRTISMVGTAVVVDGACVRIVGAATDITADRELERRLRHQAEHDDLTGLPNRRALIDRLATTDGHLLYIDVDSFKTVNDSLGHHAGDELLVALTQRLRVSVRPSDIICRFGGDEFAIMLPNCDASETDEIAQRICDLLVAPLRVADIEIYATVSIGIVEVAAGDDPTTVLRDADIALYAAKRAGRARAARFHPSMLEAAERALDLQMRIRRAVDRGEFSLYFQPIFRADDRTLVSLEALLRWTPADDEPVAPGAFLPYLEETNLIVPVGRWVVSEACRQLAAWRATNANMRDIAVSVNLSRVEFAEPDLVDHIIACVDRHDVSDGCLIVEITETVAADDVAHIAQQLRRLRNAGVRIAIDDFGVGHSSLGLLGELPLDILKIDRSFTMRLEEGSDDPIVASILALAGSLDLETVAEGVETSEQAAWLAARGCDHLQGYLLGRPQPAASLPPAPTTR